MTDDLDPSRLLASAALDNEVDADERVRVEASPEMQRERETYRSIAAELRDVEVPAVGRESAIAAALAAFDELHRSAPAGAAPAAAGAAAVVSLHERRRRQQLWMGRVAGGMAAAAVVAVIGVAALNSGSGDNKKSLSTVAVFDQSAATAAKSAPEADATLASIAAAETMPNIAASTGGAAATEAATTDPWFAAPSFTSVEELRAYALVPPTSTVSADTTAASTANSTSNTTAATAAVPSPLATCLPPSSPPVVPAFYAGQRVYLLRDEVAGLLRVIDPATCAEIVAVPLP